VIFVKGVRHLENFREHRIVMACPVGTSLRGNSFRKPWKESLQNLSCLKDTPSALTDEEKSRISEAVGGWLTDVSKKEGFLRKEFFPTAELQSIGRWIDSPVFQEEFEGKKLKIELHLLPSENPVSHATAHMVLCVLTQAQSWKDADGNPLWFSNLEIDVKEITSLPIDVDDTAKFNVSVTHLFRKYDELRGEARENEAELFINATGGFKAICAFSSVYAQVHGLRCIYTFDNVSSAVVELLPLPIAYSMEFLDDEISLLKGWKEQKGVSDIDLHNLPLWLRSLLNKDEKEPLSPLGDMLLRHYEEHHHTSGPIGSGMLDQLKDKNMREYLEERIRENWSHLWLGDQIPETVEHSRRHSKRLMELAGNLYRCAPNELEKIGMLNPNAMALLIAAIYLHDIGHTAMAHPVFESDRKAIGGVFPLGSFPSCVREVHHLLSAELIKSRVEELFPVTARIDANFREMLADLVPFLAEHHRGYTTLTSEQGTSAKCKETVRSVGKLLYGSQFEDTLEPLEKRLGKYREKAKKWGLSLGDAGTAAALLRVLDGCDVQADRTVSPEYMRARLERTKAEGEAIWWELRPLLNEKWGIFSEISDKIRSISSELDPSAAAEGNLSSNMEKDLQEHCKSVYSTVMKSLLEIKAAEGSYLLTTRNHRDFATLSLVNRYAFKWEQFLHFYKHRCVSFVLPLRKNGEVQFTVFPNSDFIKNDAMHDHLDKVIEDIEGEIKATGSLLEGLIQKVYCRHE
jgi:hypothetical protein